MLTIQIHLLSIEHFTELFIYRTYIAIEATASHQTPFGRNGEVAVTTIATIINDIIIKPLRNLKQSFLVEEERPQMILQVKSRI